MRFGFGRRTMFFGALVLLSLAMVPAAPPDFRWVAWVTAALAAFWMILLGIEDLASPRPPTRRPLEPEAPNPFVPPPPPGGFRDQG